MISNIINKWDPIDLFPYAPSDEYEEEIKLLEDFIKNNRVTESALAEEIYRVFLKRFGDDVFKKDINECSLIAVKIIMGLTSS